MQANGGVASGAFLQHFQGGRAGGAKLTHTGPPLTQAVGQSQVVGHSVVDLQNALAQRGNLAAKFRCQSACSEIGMG